MKYFITILFIFFFITSYSQPVINRGGPANTLQDARGMWLYNMFAPRYVDTTAANISTNIGIDSCGAIIFTYTGNVFYYRGCNPKRWIAFTTSATSVNIYNSDGTLTGNRTLTGAGNSLTFTGISAMNMNGTNSTTSPTSLTLDNLIQLYRVPSANQGRLDVSSGNVLQLRGGTNDQGVLINPNSFNASGGVVTVSHSTPDYVGIKLRSGGNTDMGELNIFDRQFNIQSLGDSTELRLKSSTPASVLIDSSRFAEDYGASVASANTITLGYDGNTFSITGTTNIAAITTYAWQAGSSVRLKFEGTLTVLNNTAGAAGSAPILLGGGTDFTVSDGVILELLFDGTDWHEIGRGGTPISPISSPFDSLQYVNVNKYGAVGDGQEYTNASISSGSGTLTTNVPQFSSADVGKKIAIGGAGVDGVQLIATITAFIDGQTLTVSPVASTTATNVGIKWGTDNTVPIISAINDAVTNNGTTPKVWLAYSANPYYVFDSLRTVVDGVNPNCQIPIPLVQSSSTQVALTIEGGSQTNFSTEGVALQPRSRQGVIIESLIQGTGTRPSVFGTPWYNSGQTGDKNWIQVVFKNMIVRTCTKNGNTNISGTMSAIKFGKLLKFQAYKVKTDISSDLATSVAPSDTTIGIEFPERLNQALIGGDDIFTEGYFYNAIIYEHTHIGHLITGGTTYGLLVSNGDHANTIDLFTAEACNNNIVFSGTGQLSIQQYETEHSNGGAWYDNQYDLVRYVGAAGELTILNANIVYPGQGRVNTDSSFRTLNNPQYTIVNQGTTSTTYQSTIKYRQAPIFGFNGVYSQSLNSYRIPGVGWYLDNTSNNGFLTSIDATANANAGEYGLYRIAAGSNPRPVSRMASFDLSTGYFVSDTRIGVGVTPTVSIHTQGSTNAAVSILAENTSNGNAAQADMRARNNVGDIFVLGIYGSGTSSYGALSARSALNYTTSPAGITLMADNASAPIILAAGGNAEDMRVDANGNVGIGTTSPTARLHLPAGSTSASSSPLKFTSGSLMTSAEAGAVEFLTDKYYATITTGAARKEITLNDAALTSGVTPVATTNGRLTDGLIITSTTYTPTLTNVTNITSSTAYALTVVRIGNSVIISGKIDVTNTTELLQSEIGVSLFVASNFSTDGQGNGGGGILNGSSATTYPLVITSDATNDRISIKFIAPIDSSPVTLTFSFAYQII